MTQNVNLSRSPFSSLAVELRQAILCCMPDIAALESSLEADPSLHSAFLGASSLILQTILRNIIPPKLFLQALAVLASSSLDEKTWSKKNVLDLLDSYFKCDTPHPKQWGLPEARLVSDMHRYVEFFVDDFASSAFSLRAVNSLATSPAPHSPSERHRIAGAFYRFELYSNLFRESFYPKDRYFEAEEQSYPFFERFSPWEVEQLASVYEYLRNKITPAFNDLADHDVFWGSLHIPPDASEHHKDKILSLGLAYLYRTVTATTYGEQLELLAPHAGQTYNFLLRGLYYCYVNADYGIFLSQYDADMKQALVNRCSTGDTDQGPYNAWYWVHADGPDDDFIFSPIRKTLRRKGYVMWDNSRLVSEWNFCTKPYNHEEDDPEECEVMRNDEVISYSWQRRSDIFEAGGRGWWSVEDESKIIWPDGRKPDGFK